MHDPLYSKSKIVPITYLLKYSLETYQNFIKRFQIRFLIHCISILLRIMLRYIDSRIKLCFLVHPRNRIPKYKFEFTLSCQGTSSKEISKRKYLSKMLWMRLNQGDESSSLDEIFHRRPIFKDTKGAVESAISSFIVPSYSCSLKFRASSRSKKSDFSILRGLAARKKWRKRIRGMDGELLRASTKIYEKNFNFHLRKLAGTITPGW